MALTRPLARSISPIPRRAPIRRAFDQPRRVARRHTLEAARPTRYPCAEGSTSSMKVGGGSQPIRTDRGWFLMYHGVETRRPWRLPHLLGAARLDDPSRILRSRTSNGARGEPGADAPHRAPDVPAHTVVFTTGVRTQAIVTSWRAARQTLPAASPTCPRPCSHDRALWQTA